MIKQQNNDSKKYEMNNLHNMDSSFASSSNMNNNRNSTIIHTNHFHHIPNNSVDTTSTTASTTTTTTTTNHPIHISSNNVMNHLYIPQQNQPRRSPSQQQQQSSNQMLSKSLDYSRIRMLNPNHRTTITTSTNSGSNNNNRNASQTQNQNHHINVQHRMMHYRRRRQQQQQQKNVELKHESPLDRIPHANTTTTPNNAFLPPQSSSSLTWWHDGHPHAQQQHPWNSIINQNQNNNNNNNNGAYDRSNISYAGYLLKRSNRPYYQYNNYYYYSSERNDNHTNNNKMNSTTEIHDHHRNRNDMDERMTNTDVAKETTTISTVRLTTTTSGSTNTVPSIHQQQPVDESLAFISSLFGIDVILPMDNNNNNNIYDMNESLPSTQFQDHDRPIGTSSPMPSTTASSTAIGHPSSSQPIPIRRSTPTDDDDDDDDDGNKDQSYGDRLPIHSHTQEPGPVHSPSDTLNALNHIIDPNDSHIWRRMYCVLEGDVLYFYSHQNIAESIDAILERHQQQQQSQYNGDMNDNDAAYNSDDDGVVDHDEMINDHHDNNDYYSNGGAVTTMQPRQGRRRIQTSEYNNLSQSPMPIRPLVFASDNTITASRSSRSSYLWEKRVDLQYVGSVRSVELEYGSHAIELSSSSIRDSSRSKNSVHEDDDHVEDEAEEVYDRLVLRAANNDEMKEWLFQFLRCIASFVMDMVAFRCGSVQHQHPSSITMMRNATTAGDLHYPMATSKSKSNFEYPNTATDASSTNNYINVGCDDSNTSSSPPHHRSADSKIGPISPQHRHYQEMNHNTSHSFSYGSRPGSSIHAPLSHGHGRNSLLNQRRRRGASQQQQQQQQNFDPVSPSRIDSDIASTSRIVTPILLHPSEHEPINWNLSPDTPKQQADSIFAMDSQSPTLVAGELMQKNHDTDGNNEVDNSTTVPFIPIDVLAMTASQTTIDNNIDGSATSPKLQYLPPPTTKGKYIPPHKRKQNSGSAVSITSDGPKSPLYVPRSFRSNPENGPNSNATSHDNASYQGIDHVASTTQQRDEIQTMNSGWIKLGGCSDPNHVVGSIQDSIYIPRKASQLGKVRTIPFGFSTVLQPELHPKAGDTQRKLSYEIGAVSECGVRDYNEDSFLISINLLQSFARLSKDDDPPKMNTTIWDHYSTTNSSHDPGLFAIFDGHCGDQASRYSAEELSRFLYEESVKKTHDDDANNLASTKELYVSITNAIERAMNKLDAAFCKLCVQGGREWDSGSTALIAALIDEHLIIANLGDARGIVGRSLDTNTNIDQYMRDGWNELPQTDTGGSRRCLWKEVTNIHSPNRVDERVRIETAGGWVTTESEIPIAQLKRMEWDDDDVLDILHRCFADRQSCNSSSSSTADYITSNKASAPHRVIQIARVCGILGVSRAIGDRELKASSYNDTKINTDDTTGSTDGDSPTKKPLLVSDEEYRWDSSHLGIMYPEGHDQYIVGNLISNKPEFQLVRIGEVGVHDEFLLLACDGLWDVLDPDDAYRITRDLLFDKKWSAKKTASRLSELALHLGSSDNVTVIIVRFFVE